MANKLKECPSCGKEVAKGAKVCPHCGVTLKKKWFWKLVGISIIIAIVVATMNGNKEREKNNEILANGQIENINPSNIITDVDINGLSLSEKNAKIEEKKQSIEQNYGKLIQWTLIVKSVSKTVNDSYEVTVGRNRTIMFGIENFADVVLEKKYSKYGESLAMDDKITFKGVLTRGGLTVTYTVKPAELIAVNGKKLI